MIEINVTGRQNYELKHLVLDLNGTLACDGILIEGVEERIATLNKIINIIIITADTHGSAEKLGKQLQVTTHRIKPGNEPMQKLQLVQQLGSNNVVAIGNGSNDILILRESVIGICVLGPESTAAEAITNCDIVAPTIHSALDLLIKPNRLMATLRR